MADLIDDEDFELTPKQLAELDRRIELDRKYPGRGRLMEDVFAELLGEKKQRGPASPETPP